MYRRKKKMQAGRNQLADDYNSPGKEVRISASGVNGETEQRRYFQEMCRRYIW